MSSLARSRPYRFLFLFLLSSRAPRLGESQSKLTLEYARRFTSVCEAASTGPATATKRPASSAATPCRSGFTIAGENDGSFLPSSPPGADRARTTAGESARAAAGLFAAPPAAVLRAGSAGLSEARIDDECIEARAQQREREERGRKAGFFLSEIERE